MIVYASTNSLDKAKALRADPSKRKASNKYNPPTVPLLGPEVMYMPHQAATLDTLYDKGRDTNTFGCDAYGLDVAMGGGKTILMLSDALMALESGRVRRPLLVMPTNTIRQQKMEILNFTRRPLKNTDGEDVLVDGKPVYQYPVNVVVLAAQTCGPREPKHVKGAKRKPTSKYNEDDLMKLVSKAPPNTIFIASYSWLSGASNVSVKASKGAKGRKEIIMDSNMPEGSSCPSQYQIKFKGSKLITQAEAKIAFPGFPFNDFPAMWELVKEHPDMAKWFAHEAAKIDYPVRNVGVAKSDNPNFSDTVSKSREKMASSKKPAVDPSSFFTGADLESTEAFNQKYPSFATPPYFAALQDSESEAGKRLGPERKRDAQNLLGRNPNLGLFDLCQLAYHPKLAKLNPWVVVPRRPDRLLECGIDYVALDESHTIKNKDSQVSQVLSAFSDKRVKVRRAASGTMMNNKPEDLIEQLNWMLPLYDESTGEVIGNRIFGRSDAFTQKFCRDVGGGVLDWRNPVDAEVFDPKTGEQRMISDHALKIVKAMLNNASNAITGSGDEMETEVASEDGSYVGNQKITKVGPFLTSLRRTNWLHLLPPKTEQVHAAPFTKMQQAAYDIMSAFMEETQALNNLLASVMYESDGAPKDENVTFEALNACLGRKGGTGLSVTGGVGGEALGFAAAMSSFCDNPDPSTKGAGIRNFGEDLKWLNGCIDTGKFTEKGQHEDYEEPAGEEFVTDDEEESSSKDEKQDKASDATKDLIAALNKNKELKAPLQAALTEAVATLEKMAVDLDAIASNMAQSKKTASGQPAELVSTKVFKVDEIIKKNSEKPVTEAEKKLLKGAPPPRKVMVLVEDKASAMTLRENSRYKNESVYYSASEVAALERFKTDPKIKVLFGVAQSLRVGHNLQMVNCMIVCKCPYAPGDLGQELARAFRIGQKQPVDVHIILATATGFPGFDASPSALAAFEATRAAARSVQGGGTAMSAPYDCYRFSQLVDKKSDISLIDSDIGVSDFPHPTYVKLSQSDFLGVSEVDTVKPRVEQYLAIDEYEYREAEIKREELGEEMYYANDSDDRQSILEGSIMPIIVPLVQPNKKPADMEAELSKPILERGLDTFSGFDWEDPDSPATELLDLSDEDLKAMGFEPDGTPTSMKNHWTGTTQAEIREKLSLESRLSACDVPAGLGAEGNFSKPFSYILQEQDVDLLTECVTSTHQSFAKAHPMNVMPRQNLAERDEYKKAEYASALKVALTKLVGKKVVGGFGLLQGRYANTLGRVLGERSVVPKSLGNVNGLTMELLVVGRLRPTLDGRKEMTVGLFVIVGGQRDEDNTLTGRPQATVAAVKVIADSDDESRLDFPAMDALPIGTAIKPKPAFYEALGKSLKSADSKATVDIAKGLASIVGKGASHYTITTVDSATFEPRGVLTEIDGKQGMQVQQAPTIKYRAATQFRIDIASGVNNPEVAPLVEIMVKAANGSVIVPGLRLSVVKDSEGNPKAVSGSYQSRFSQGSFDVVPGKFGTFDPIRRSKERLEASKQKALSTEDDEKLQEIRLEYIANKAKALAQRAEVAAVLNNPDIHLSKAGFGVSEDDVNKYLNDVHVVDVYGGGTKLELVLRDVLVDHFGAYSYGGDDIPKYFDSKESANSFMLESASEIGRMVAEKAKKLAALAEILPTMTSTGLDDLGPDVIIFRKDILQSRFNLVVAIIASINPELINYIVTRSVSLCAKGGPRTAGSYGGGDTGFGQDDWRHSATISPDVDTVFFEVALKEVWEGLVENDPAFKSYPKSLGDFSGSASRGARLDQLTSDSPEVKELDSLLRLAGQANVRGMVAKLVAGGSPYDVADLATIQDSDLTEGEDQGVDLLKGRKLQAAFSAKSVPPKFQTTATFFRGQESGKVGTMLRNAGEDLELSKLGDDDCVRIGAATVGEFISVQDAGYAIGFNQTFNKKPTRGAYLVFDNRLLQVGSSTLKGSEVWRITYVAGSTQDKAELVHLGFYDNLDAKDLMTICKRTSDPKAASDAKVSHPLEKAGRKPVGGKSPSGGVVSSAMEDWNVLTNIQ